MRPISKPRVKVCCISSVDEARLAIRYGASALGLVSEMPSGPGVISEDSIREIAGFAPPGVSTFLLTSLRRPEEIAAQALRCGTNAVQICDRLDGRHIDLRKSLPSVKLVQVVHVTGDESIDEAMEVAQEVDAVLLDSGNQDLEIKELGGTGRIHDWEISRRIVESVPCPVFLAGGLDPGNIAEAVAAVRPFGIDLCSGVRTDGGLDESKLAGFFANI